MFFCLLVVVVFLSESKNQTDPLILRLENVNVFYSKDKFPKTHHHIRINQALGMIHLNTVVVKNTETAKLTIRYIQYIIFETENTKTKRKLHK